MLRSLEVHAFTAQEIPTCRHAHTHQRIASRVTLPAPLPQGVNVTALREIKILRELSPHPNIINLIDAFPQKKNILLVRMAAG